MFHLQVIGFIALFQGYQRVHVSYLSIAIMLFSLDQMLIFIEICVTLLFPNFKLIFYQYLFHLQVIGFIALFQGYQRVHVSYLSIHADR